MARYKCSKCGAVAEIDKEKKTMTIQPLAPKVSSGARQIGTSFPSHADCELGKSIEDIDLSKLEKAEGYQFKFEEGK